MQGLGVQPSIDPSRPGGVLVAVDELQKITHGLEELTIGLRARLSPVLRDDAPVDLNRNSSTTPDPPRAPLDHQIRLVASQLQQISANLDYILKHLEV